MAIYTPGNLIGWANEWKEQRYGCTCGWLESHAELKKFGLAWAKDLTMLQVAVAENESLRKELGIAVKK